MNLTSGMPLVLCAKVYLLKLWETKPDCCEMASHRSKEMEIVNADQSVKEVGCELEEAWRYWKGTQA